MCSKDAGAAPAGRLGPLGRNRFPHVLEVLWSDSHVKHFNF